MSHKITIKVKGSTQYLIRCHIKVSVKKKRPKLSWFDKSNIMCIPKSNPTMKTLSKTTTKEERPYLIKNYHGAQVGLDL